MFIVTGGAGFIGSNIVRALNSRGIDDILVVDNLERGDKFLNLQTSRIGDYMDKREFRALIENDKLDIPVEVILHQGACSDTMQGDGRYMLDNNFTFSKLLLHFALARRIPLVYASSAATYGAGERFVEEPGSERPLNVYGYSKLLFDNYVRRHALDAQSTVVGLRYFNVYGPNEAHKGRMASAAHQFALQLKNTNVIRLFEGSGGYGDGEQRRDFVFVGDVAEINLHFAMGRPRSGIFNVGTGHSRSFNDVARCLIDLHGSGSVEYVPFPPALRGKYQHFTQADISALRRAGYTRPFIPLEDGTRELVASLS